MVEQELVVNLGCNGHHGDTSVVGCKREITLFRHRNDLGCTPDLRRVMGGKNVVAKIEPCGGEMWIFPEKSWNMVRSKRLGRFQLLDDSV